MPNPRHYDPNQPRVPAGQPGGGRWTEGGYKKDTILQGGPTLGRFGPDTILQPPQAKKGDAQDPLLHFAYYRGRRPRAPIPRNTPSEIERQRALELERKALERAREKAAEIAREKAVEYGLALFSALSALNSPDRRAVIEFEAHEYGRDKENTLKFKKLGILTEAEFRKRCDYLDKVQEFADEGARKANTKTGLDPRTYGTDVHEYVKEKINGMRKADFWAERSALKSSAALPYEVRRPIQEDGEPPRGYADTVRTDGYEYVGQATGCIYEIKTGEAEFTPSRMREFADAIFATDDIYRDPKRITEIKQNFAKRGLPVLRLIMTVIRPTVPRVLNPAR